MPAVVLWNGNKLSPGAGTIHSYALSVRTKMPPPGQTITAVSTSDVSLADDEVAARKSLDVVTGRIDDAGKLVTDGHRHRYSFLRPVIPVVDVHVGPADRRL